ncbi:hypothetical protein GQ54DRAFT_297162 [Martensiomyces pterosporus]|nr:hypothetical protein GQ54DRAFT_297162 [Martensiomyces pterosporus]
MPRKQQQQQQQSTAAAPVRPRWYNQMYLMFLALRQSPGYTASRSDLVRKAVELDKRISRERSLPRAFTGKTPLNSASALLTNNWDKHFIQFRPEGAKCYHFRLAYDPGDFESALRAYSEWVDILIKKDWPVCFGPEPNEGIEPAASASSSTDTTVPQQPTNTADTATAGALADVMDASHADNAGPATDSTDSGTSPDIPKSWRDIVQVNMSMIPNAGNGLFAVRDLPAGIPLGFYFGVPMTEDEFDSLKDNVGVASHYSIMYRKTVLDATDEHGAPYTDPDGPLYCPFHFMNEDRDGKHCNIVFLEGAKVNQIICLTSRDIKAGEELLVSYGDEVDRSHWEGNQDSGSSTCAASAGVEGGSDGGDASADPLLSTPPTSPSRNWGMRATPVGAAGDTSPAKPIRRLLTTLATTATSQADSELRPFQTSNSG